MAKPKRGAIIESRISSVKGERKWVDKGFIWWAIQQLHFVDIDFLILLNCLFFLSFNKTVKRNVFGVFIPGKVFYQTIVIDLVPA